MGNSLDAPVRSSDAFVPEASPGQERPLVTHPNNPTDAADFQSTYAAALASGKDSRLTDPMLKGFEITGDLSGGSTDTASTDSTSSTTSEISNDSDGDGIPDSTDTVEVTCSEMQAGDDQIDTDYDGIPDDPNLLSSTQLKDLIDSVEHGNEVIPDDPNLPADAVLEQISELQEDHDRGEDAADIASNPNAIEFSHAGEDSHEDTGSNEALPTSQNGTHHYQVNEVGQKRKRQAKAESGELPVGLSGAGSDELVALNALKLEARGFAGESTAALGPLPQGIDKISIADITTRKEEDGSVVLVAPRGGDSNADRVAIVDKDGFNIKAATLPGFLRPDGTIVIGEDGRAYRPGDNFVAAKPTDEGTNFAIDPYEKSVALNSSDSTINNTAEMSFEPNDSAQQQAQEAAEQQRSIKVRLGETLRSLALRELDDAKNWVVLAKANNLSTETNERGAPIASLQRGMILNLPTASEIENFQARASLAASLQLT